MWDTVGQERFQGLGSSFYRGANACVLVFDMTRRSTFTNLAFWRNEYLLQASTTSRSDSPFVVIGTKCDRADIEVSPDEVIRWCEEQGLSSTSFFRTSAKTNINVEDSFNYVIQTAVQHSFRQCL